MPITRADYQSFLKSFAWMQRLHLACTQRMVQVLALLEHQALSRAARLSKKPREKIRALLNRCQALHEASHCSIRTTMKSVELQQSSRIEVWVATLTFNDQQNLYDFLNEQYAELNAHLKNLAGHYGVGTEQSVAGFYFVEHFIRIFKQASRNQDTFLKLLNAFEGVLVQGSDQGLSGSEKFAALMAHCQQDFVGKGSAQDEGGF